MEEDGGIEPLPATNKYPGFQDQSPSIQRHLPETTLYTLSHGFYIGQQFLLL